MGQVLSPGLVQFRRRYIRDRSIPLRLGEIYYAAPDLSFPVFARQLPQYIDMGRRVRVLNQKLPELQQQNVELAVN